MSEVCDLCEVCGSDGAGTRTCQKHPDTCQTCHVPKHQCNPTGEPGIFCCALDTNTGYVGIDCGDGQLCPAGHQCVELFNMSQQYIGSNCFPTSDSVCQAETCK